ncbi:hypothetical protein WA577_007286, partial [Blastocystis sp. JDR]
MQSFVDEASYTGNRTINMPEEDPNAYYYGKSVYTKKCSEMWSDDRMEQLSHSAGYLYGDQPSTQASGKEHQHCVLTDSSLRPIQPREEAVAKTPSPFSYYSYH